MGEVQYFLLAIGFSHSKCEEFKSAGITGKKVVKIGKAELKSEYGCSSAEAEVFMASIEFAVKVVETECGCKELKAYTEIEVCMVMISVGLGTKVEKIHKHEITGKRVIKMDYQKLQKKCGMTDYQVTKFKAVFGVSITIKGDRSRSNSPCSSRSSSCSSRSSKSSKGSCGGKKGSKTVKVTKTTVTK